MKARHIKKLRKKIGKLQTYKIRETASLFGNFFGQNRFNLIMSDHNITANSPIRAIKIYMRNYRKKQKQKNRYESEEYVETTEDWGRLMVVDETGFKYFYK